MRRLALTFLALLALCSSASAQCSGTFTAGQVCANSTASAGLAKQTSPTAWFDRAFCGTANAIIQRVGGTWRCPTPSGTVLDDITGFASIGVMSRTGDGTYTFSSIASLTGRTRLVGATNFYVRTAPVSVTVSIASPGVVTRATHGLSANDPVVLAILPNTALVTVTIATPGVVTWTGSNFAAGQPIRFRTTNAALPTGITPYTTTYFVIATGLTANTFQFSTTVGGAAVNTSGTQSGSHFGETTGMMPTGLAEGTVYYVKTVLDANTFTLSATPGGAVINTTGSTNGTITLTTGNDSNACTAATRAAACLNLQQTHDKIASSYDFAGFTATINAAESRYDAGLLIQASLLPPNGLIQFLGNTTIPGNVWIATTSGSIQSVASTVRGQLAMAGFKLSAANDCSYSAFGGTINYTGYMEFGDCSGMQIRANVNGATVINGGYRISGGGNGHFYVSKDSTIEGNASTVTLMTASTGASPSFITFATAINKATLSVSGITWTGLAGGSKYNADGSDIATGTAGNINYFPGSSVGVTINGGVYDTGLLSDASNVLGGDVNLNNTANYFDGPSMAQGTVGKWYASGTVTLTDTVQALILCKLWDGTTIIASSAGTVSAGFVQTVSLSGVLANPVGNIRISCRDFSATSGVMKSNTTGSSKDGTVSGFRLNFLIKRDVDPAANDNMPMWLNKTA